MREKKIFEEKELIKNILKKLDNEETKDFTDAEESLIEKTLIDAAFNESQKTDLVEEMNKLFYLPKAKKHRKACYKYIESKIIEKNLSDRLEKTSQAIKKLFEENKITDKTDSKKVLDEMIEIFRSEEYTSLNKDIAKGAAESLSEKLTKDKAGQTAKQYLFNMCGPTTNAKKNADKCLTAALENEEIKAFVKTLQSTPSVNKSKTKQSSSENKSTFSEGTWSKFKNGTDRTTPATLDFIADKLGLSEEERKKAHSLNLPENFIPDEEFIEHLDSYFEALIKARSQKGKKFNIEVFCDYNDISSDVLKKINPGLFRKRKTTAEETEKKSKPVKYYELLKLVAAFRMDQASAEKFLEKADYYFAMATEIAFLTAITKGYEIIEAEHNRCKEEKRKHPCYDLLKYKAKNSYYVALIIPFLSGEFLYNKDRKLSKIKSPYNIKYITESGRGLFEERLKELEKELQNR